MKTIPLLFIMLFAQQASQAQASSECLSAVESTTKNRMEKLMNQYYLGQIGGQEFEGKRLETLGFSETETEACVQNAVQAELQQVNEKLAAQASRAPASVFQDIPSHEEESESHVYTELKSSSAFEEIIAD